MARQTERVMRTLALALLVVLSSATMAQTARNIDVYDGFESRTVSNIWETDRFAPGAVEMQSAIVRAGKGAAKITVRPHDVFEAGINGNSDSERAELLEARKLVSQENQAYEYSFSLFFPPDFPIVPTRLVVAQWKQYCGEKANCSDDSPVLAVRYISGTLRITQNIGKTQKLLYEEKGEFRNRWLDFKFQVRFSPTESGRIKAWIDGKLVLDYSGATAYPENSATGYRIPSYFYFKMGLYRNVMSQPMTVYVDEYRKRTMREGEM